MGDAPRFGCLIKLRSGTGPLRSFFIKLSCLGVEIKGGKPAPDPCLSLLYGIAHFPGGGGFGPLGLPHGPQDDEGTDRQGQAHDAEAGLGEDRQGQGLHGDETQIMQILRDCQSPAHRYDEHDGAHDHLDHVLFDISGADGAQLHPDEGAGQDDQGEADVDHAVHGPFDGAEEAHHEGDDQFGSRSHQAGGPQP